MVKYYCDRCKKETDSLTNVNVPNAHINPLGNHSLKEFALCKECKREYDSFSKVLFVQTATLKITMCNHFMEAGESK